MKKMHLMTLFAGVALALTPMTSRAADDADKKGSGFTGKVTAFDATAMTMTVEKKKGEESMAYTMTEDTKIVDADNADAEATTITVGSRVRVMTDEEGSLAAKRIKVLPLKKDKDGTEVDDSDDSDDNADE
jgi:hypothetical protein